MGWAKITDLHRETGRLPSGRDVEFWVATVYTPDPPDGNTRVVDCKFGSWQTVPRHPAEPRSFVLAPIADALQREVHKIERREGIAIHERGSVADL